MQNPQIGIYMLSLGWFEIWIMKYIKLQIGEKLQTKKKKTAPVVDVFMGVPSIV